MSARPFHTVRKTSSSPASSGWSLSAPSSVCPRSLVQIVSPEALETRKSALGVRPSSCRVTDSLPVLVTLKTRGTGSPVRACAGASSVRRNSEFDVERSVRDQSAELSYDVAEGTVDELSAARVPSPEHAGEFHVGAAGDLEDVRTAVASTNPR